MIKPTSDYKNTMLNFIQSSIVIFVMFLALLSYPLGFVLYLLFGVLYGIFALILIILYPFTLGYSGKLIHNINNF